MPAVAVGVGVAAAGAYGAHKQASAATKAATIQTAGADKAAGIQAQSAREALAFQKEQAAADAARFEQTQRSNYDQWAARQGYQSSIGSMLGLPARNIPGYQSSMPSGSPQGMPSAGGGDPKVAAFVADYQAKHPITEGIGPIADALKKAGLSSGRYDYGGGNLSNNEVTVGGKPYKVLGGEGTPAAYWYTPGTNDAAPGAAIGGGSARGYVAPLSSFLPQPYQPLTPALRMPGGY